MLRFLQSKYKPEMWTHDTFETKLSKALDNDRRDFYNQLKVDYIIY